MIIKTLKGLIVQDQTELYQYILPETGINSVQNALSSANFEEVFIDCYTDNGAQEMKLPLISSFRRGFSPKIYITNKGSLVSGTVLILPSSSETEIKTINFTGSWQIEKGQSAYLHIVNNTNWACWVTPLPA